MSNSTYEEVIERDGTLVYTNTGYSMLPLIRPTGDLIVIKKCTKPLKKYDVPLYKRTNGQYVLHRIVRVKKDGYVIVGDNCTYTEHGIKDEQIIGVLHSVIRDGEEILMNSKKQKIYAFFRTKTYFFRVARVKLYKLLRN